MENSPLNLNINPLPPTDEALSFVQQSKGKLPKLELDRGERLNIGIEELSALHKAFFDLLSDMKEGGLNASAELRSYMDSVSFYVYVNEIAKLRLQNKLEGDTEWARLETLTEILTPRTWRGWFFRKKRNEAKVLQDELIGRQSWQYLKRKQEELPNCGEVQETEIAPYTLVIESLRELLPRRMRKNKRALWEAVIEGLTANYEAKSEEHKKCAEELGEVKAQFDRAQEKISELQELVEQLMSESEPVEDDQNSEETSEMTESPLEDEEKSQETEESAKESEEMRETASIEGVELDESADEEEEDGLSYDGLEEDEESE